MGAKTKTMINDAENRMRNSFHHLLLNERKFTNEPTRLQAIIGKTEKRSKWRTAPAEPLRNGCISSSEITHKSGGIIEERIETDRLDEGRM